MTAPDAPNKAHLGEYVSRPLKNSRVYPFRYLQSIASKTHQPFKYLYDAGNNPRFRWSDKRKALDFLHIGFVEHIHNLFFGIGLARGCTQKHVEGKKRRKKRTVHGIV